MSLSWASSIETKLLYYDDPYLSEFESRVAVARSEGGKLYVVLEETCFHPEGGGQPGDTGILEWGGGVLRVVDTKLSGRAVVHVCEGRQLPRAGELVRGKIDWGRRYQLMKSHTASHIVFSAARRVLGVEKLVYKGFQIDLEKVRMDISYGKPIAREQLERIEQLANTIAMEGRRVRWMMMSREEAERRYGSKLGVTEVTPAGEVRVVEVEGWDVSLCSGTHVKLTSEVSPIRILGRTRLQKGVERLEFAAGEPAYKAVLQQLKLAEQAARILGVSLSKLPDAADAAAREKSKLRKELAKLSAQLAEYVASELARKAEQAGQVRYLVGKLSLPPDVLKKAALTAVARDPSLVVILGSGGSLAIAAGSKAVEAGVSCIQLFKEATRERGKGGGGVKFAQGSVGGSLEQALKEAASLLHRMLGVEAL